MRNNKLVMLTALAASCMMIITACGKPATAEPTTEAVTTTAEVTTTETTETTDETSTAAESSGSVVIVAEESTVSETVSPEVGSTDASGKFTAKSGKFEIKVPTGWVVDPSSDSEYTTLLSPEGSDFIEIIYSTGDIEDAIQTMPESVDDYKAMVSRGDENFEISNYKVENTADGKGQTYQYSVKYKDSDVQYMSISGYYDLNAKESILVTATVETEGAEAVKAVDDAMASFKINK